MAFFKKKKTEEACECGCTPQEPAEQPTCDCGGNCPPGGVSEPAEAPTQEKSIKVLGNCCKKCDQLEAATKEALAELGLDESIDHVSDFAQIAAYGVMTTPALVIDGKVVSFGKVLKKEEIIAFINKARG